MQDGGFIANMNNMDELLDSTVCGYRVKELLLFAEACRKQGITETELHDFCLNVESAYQLVIDEQREVTEKYLAELMGGEHNQQ